MINSGTSHDMTSSLKIDENGRLIFGEPGP